MKYIIPSLVVLVAASLMTSLSADVIKITGDTADRALMVWENNPNFDGGVNSSTFRAGVAGTDAKDGKGRAIIFVFQLPANLASTNISSISFSATLASITSAGYFAFSGDLYALGVRSVNEVLKTDYYVGANDVSTGASLIQDDFVTSATSLGVVSTDASGNENLTSFVKAQLDAGKAGQYIFLRINPDYTTLPATIPAGYNFASADHSDGENLWPTLTITTSSIPEPSIVAMFIGITGFLLTCGSRFFCRVR